MGNVFSYGSFLNYFRNLFGPREFRILILGLDGSGKTTFLQQLKLGEVTGTIPTIGFNLEEVTLKNIKFQVWDLGGQSSVRPYWRCYYLNTDAIIFVVDSTDRERIETSKEELMSILEEEELSETILVVMANKQDVEGCMSSFEIYQKLALGLGDGIDSAMEWLAGILQHLD